MKLGKLPATYDHRDLCFADYRRPMLGTSKLPKHPVAFGHESLVGDWGVLGNSDWGDCVFAGAAHETMLWNAARGAPVQFTDEGVLSDYSAVTGFNPNDPNTDQGTDVRKALGYRRKVGVVDALGRRHKIGAYLALEPGNWEHLLEALFLFEAVGIGIRFPKSAMTQFDRGRIWSVVSGSPNEGGHYIPLVSYRSRLACVTWGKLQQMTESFYVRNCDEAWVILSTEMLKDGKTLEGMDMPALQADLKAVTA